jgi:hypothetical protein
VDNSAWFGESPGNPDDQRPALFATGAGNLSVVLSNACFGAYIGPHYNKFCAAFDAAGTCTRWDWSPAVEKNTTNSIALHFLANGAHAVIGNTDVGYVYWRMKKVCTRSFLGICLQKGYKKVENDLGHGEMQFAQYFFDELAKGWTTTHPLDAYFRAKQRYGQELPEVLVNADWYEADLMMTNWRTLMQLLYLGVPPPQ